MFPRMAVSVLPEASLPFSSRSMRTVSTLSALTSDTTMLSARCVSMRLERYPRVRRSPQVLGIRSVLMRLRTPVTCGVGVAVSGIVDPRSGDIIRSANFELTGKPLVSDIQSASGLPVYIDNRARMAARAEMFSGAARGIDDFLLVSLGKGIGSAFSFSGRLHFGVSGKAGELRDIIVPDHYSGCGVTTLEKALSEDTLEQQDYPCRIMADICASGFRQVLNVTAQEVLILAGRFSMFPKSFHDELRRKMPDIDLRLSQFGRDSGACGGAVAAAENTIFSQL